MSNTPTLAPPVSGDRTGITFWYECVRAVGTGVLETAGTTFIMLIAIRHFHASAGIKSLVAVNDKAGLLLSPVIVTLVTVFRVRCMRGAAALLGLGTIGCLTAAIIPHVYALAWGTLLGMTCAAAAIPLITQIYQDNYPAERRGKLFSRQLFIRIASAAAFGYLTSRFLEGHLEGAPRAWWSTLRDGRFEPFQQVLAGFAVAMGISALALYRIPSAPLADPGPAARNPFYALRFVRDDKTFRNTLISWMFVGMANLMMQALRVEFLANTERYHVTLGGQPLTVLFIALLTDIVPNLARLCMSPIWGRFFDRFNFFALRIAINLGFGVAIITFFTGDTYAGHLAGAVIWGISIAGGDLCWSLWVTKLAPPHRVAHYMSIHTFLTGVRGIAAPFLAFGLVGHLSLGWMATVTAVMIALACLVLVPELLSQRPMRPEVEEQFAE